MESNKANSTSNGTINVATSSTPTNMPRDGSTTESIIGSILSQIEERQTAYQEHVHRYRALFSSNASGERMTDVVNSSTQTMIPVKFLHFTKEGESDLEEDDGQNLNRENMSYQALFEHHKRINIGLRVRAFDLSIKLHKYESPKSTCLDNKECCSICLDDYCDRDELAEIDCSHVYHVDCIKEWIKLKNSCPICKRDALAILT
ncbi:E3 ubiquitin-protein ligase MBR1-like [Solanum dulcamara]|uniref:E3 ubiquitin-protein ligase MBR1-like n=1 Tax=Solanum dulcamara TaxID=45834 RepID=UPI0024862A71|nr:E3 ubiquitin-protein ligase MBR1-like [Solanum dulcamara]